MMYYSKKYRKKRGGHKKNQLRLKDKYKRYYISGLISIFITLFSFEYLFVNDKVESGIHLPFPMDRNHKELSNITASFVPKIIPSMTMCKNITSSSHKNELDFIPPDNPLIVEGFPNTPLIGNGFLDLNGPYNSILFKAKSSKFLNGPILSTGSNMLFQQTDIEYRLMEVKGYLNYSGIRNGEGVESDFCVTLTPMSLINSVSSGEELICSHETFYGGDRSPITNRQGDHKAPFVEFKFGPHGIPLKYDYKLSIASVSKIYTAEAFHPLSAEDTAARDAPPEPIDVPGVGNVTTSLDLLALNFEALIIPVRSKSQGKQGLRSLRIPQRDRSAMPFINTKDALPLTSYQNIGDHPIPLRGIGIFRSVLDYYVVGYTTIKVFVNKKEILTYCPQPHVPGISSARFEDTIPIDIDLQPNEIVRVEHSLSSFIPQRYIPKQRRSLPEIFDPAPYDLAIYVLYDNGNNDLDTSVLIPFEETNFVNASGGIDLNNDGIDDFVEYDIVGNIWKELSTAEGAHDTQHIGFQNLITKKGKFNKNTTSWLWKRNAATTMMEATVTDKVENICFHLKGKVRIGFNNHLFSSKFLRH